MTQGFISSTLTLPVPVTSGGTGLTSTTINQLLYSSAANTIAGLATANNGVLVTSAGGVPSISSTLPSGMAATNMTLTTPTLGAATATSITFSPTTGGIVGTTTNNNTDAGKVGELVSSVVLLSGSPVALTTNTPINVTSISLTAGDWDVWGNITLAPNAATSITYSVFWVSQTSATLPDQALSSGFNFAGGILGSYFNMGMAVPPLRFSLSGTTTIYLSTQCGFTINAMSAAGGIYARRRR